MAQLNDLIVLGNTNLVGETQASNITADKFIGNLTGKATSADKLNTNAGSAT